MGPETPHNPTPLLILGSARSGTTLFQRVLNSYDNVIIWGEHAGFLKPVAESYFNLKESPSMAELAYPQALGPNVDISEYKKPHQWQAWNNWFSPNDLTHIYKNLLTDLFIADWGKDLKYWGFKEIRYGENDLVVDFFLSTYKDTKIVFIYRNPLNVIESQLSAFSRVGGRLEKFRKIIMLRKIIKMAVRWKKINQGLLKHYKKSPDAITIFSYEKFISDKKFTEAIFKGLDLDFSEKQREVMEMKSGRGSAYSDNLRSATDNRWKRLGLIPALAVYLITRGTYVMLKSIN